MATPSHVQFYEAVRGHIEALRKLGAKEAIMAAIGTEDPGDLRWLKLTGGVDREMLWL